MALFGNGGQGHEDLDRLHADAFRSDREREFDELRTRTRLPQDWRDVAPWKRVWCALRKALARAPR